MRNCVESRGMKLIGACIGLRTGLLIVVDWCWPKDLDLCKIVRVLLAGFFVEEFGPVLFCCAGLYERICLCVVFFSAQPPKCVCEFPIYDVGILVFNGRQD